MRFSGGGWQWNAATRNHRGIVRPDEHTNERTRVGDATTCIGDTDTWFTTSDPVWHAATRLTTTK